MAIFTGAAAVAQSGKPTTLAVLPLENNSGDAAQDFFAGGMTDEIAVALAGVHGLGVVARSSSFQLKPADRESQAAGKALNAGHIVQGTARMSDDRVQVSLRLMRSSDGMRLWAEDFDAKLSGIFDLQEEIARKVGSALQLPIGAEADPQPHAMSPPISISCAPVAARPRGLRRCKRRCDRQRWWSASRILRRPQRCSLCLCATPLFAPCCARACQEERKIVERTTAQQCVSRRATGLDSKNAEAFVALGYANMVQRRMLAARMPSCR